MFKKTPFLGDTVDASEIPANQLRLVPVVNPTIYRIFLHPRWLASEISEPSTVCREFPGMYCAQAKNHAIRLPSSGHV